MSGLDNSSSFPKMSCSQCGGLPAMSHPHLQIVNSQKGYHQPNPISVDPTPVVGTNATLWPKRTKEAKSSELPKMGASVPGVPRVSTGTFTVDPPVIDRSTRVPAQTTSEARIGRTREDYLILKYVLYVSKPDLDLTTVPRSFPKDRKTVTRTSRRVVGIARSAIIHHEYYKRFPNAGFENLLDKISGNNDSHQKLAWAKRAIQMHEAALAIIARDNKVPTRSLVSKELARQARHDGSNGVCHPRNMTNVSPFSCDPWQPGRAPRPIPQPTQPNQPSAFPQPIAINHSAPNHLDVRLTLETQHGQSGRDVVRPNSRDTIDWEQWSQRLRTSGHLPK